jgi:7,8-dihydropterin-6-yl-methyl-4-(beta-D-ribofuranosyl)aminobenzene 5'-phosphate synthase
MSAKITILYDNRCSDCRLQEGWGFSACVEFDGKKILFDTGGDYQAFSTNADKLNLSYHDSTHLLLSHPHWDHIAGLKEITEKMNKDCEVYIPKWFALRHRKKVFSSFKTTVVRSFEEIAPNVFSLVLKAGFLLYEQILILKTHSGLGIITGCAHPGIVHILKTAQKYLQEPILFVVGGFHLFSKPDTYCTGIVKQFQELGVCKVAPCHCSGDELIKQFQEAYGQNYVQAGTGAVIRF